MTKLLNLQDNLDRYKIIHEFLIFISFLIWFLSLDELLLANIIIAPFSTEYSSIQFLLLLVILTSLGKISSYLDYQTPSVFSSDGKDYVNYENMLLLEHQLEKKLRWILDTYKQIIIGILLVLVTIPSMFSLFENHSNLFYFLVMVFGWFFIMLIALLFNLLTEKTMEFRIGFEIYLKSFIILIAFISILSKYYG